MDSRTVVRMQDFGSGRGAPGWNRELSDAFGRWGKRIGPTLGLVGSRAGSEKEGLLSMLTICVDRVFSGGRSVDFRETLVDFIPVAAVHGERVWMRERATGRALAFALELDTQRLLFPVHVEGWPILEVPGPGIEAVVVGSSIASRCRSNDLWPFDVSLANRSLQFVSLFAIAISQASVTSTAVGELSRSEYLFCANVVR